MNSGFATIVIQHASGVGQRLEAQTGEWHHGEDRSISPGAVAAIVRYAIDQGWRPTSTRPPLRLRNIDSAMRFRE